MEAADAGDSAPRPPRGPKVSNQRPPMREEERRDDRGERRGFGPGSGGGGSGIRYPDNQQIFVGNLPYDMSENDLREHFQGTFKCTWLKMIIKSIYKIPWPANVPCGL